MHRKAKLRRGIGKRRHRKSKIRTRGHSERKKDKIIVYSFYPFMKKNETFEKGNIPKATMYFVNGALTLLLINRWIISGHFPLSNLYESLIFLSWSFATIYSITSFTLPSTILPVIGSSIAPITLLTCAFAFFCIPQELQKSQSLVPALQSNWLIMHVSVMILSYASLLLGSLFALTLLLTERFSKQKSSNCQVKSLGDELSPDTSYSYALWARVSPFLNSLPILSSQPKNKMVTSSSESLVGREALPKVKSNSKNSNLLDNISYRFIGLGFALLTLGIISGAVWANFAWGSYWSWDPKETWAFITWLTYAFYLHLRISKGWYGEQSASVAIFGFFVVWFCYLGVNLFGKGLHSYAFV